MADLYRVKVKEGNRNVSKHVVADSVEQIEKQLKQPISEYARVAQNVIICDEVKN